MAAMQFRAPVQTSMKKWGGVSTQKRSPFHLVAPQKVEVGGFSLETQQKFTPTGHFGACVRMIQRHLMNSVKETNGAGGASGFSARC